MTNRDPSRNGTASRQSIDTGMPRSAGRRRSNNPLEERLMQTTTETQDARLEPEGQQPKSHDTLADPFDVESLRISQDYADSIGLKKALLTIPVRKPDKTWFVRTHADPAYRIETAVIELKEDRETYLVSPHVREELATETALQLKALFTAVNRQGVVFLWPINLPGLDGRTNDWNRSALEAETLAREHWVRIQANMALGAYSVWTAETELPEPNWPQQPFKELLRIAFKNHFIDDLEHPVLKRLRGEL